MNWLQLVVAVVVTTVWAAVVIRALASSPIDPQLVTLATIVTPVMLGVVGWLLAEPWLHRSRNRRRRDGRR